MTTLKYEHIVDAVYHHPWAILPEKYAAICEFVRFKAEGGYYSTDEIQAQLGAVAPKQGAVLSGSVAVLPLYGVISQRVNLMSAMSGGTSTEQFGQAFRQALADPQVSALVIDVDSPGGNVQGVQELWDVIAGSRGDKPIVAVANSTMASAAYWISSAADEIVATPSAEVGSIGVIAAHQDISQASEMAGVKTTLITAGKYKGEGNPFEPLGEEARGYIQQRVDSAYADFVRAVASGRNVKISDVRGGFGQGRVVGARDAVMMGMADRVDTLEGTINRLTGTPRQQQASQRRRAMYR